MGLGLGLGFGCALGLGLRLELVLELGPGFRGDGRVREACRGEDARDAHAARGKGRDETDDPAVTDLPVHAPRLPHGLPETHRRQTEQPRHQVV